MEFILPIIILIILIYINSFFASAEIAVISLNKAKLQKLIEDGDRNAEKLLKLTEDSSKFLSTIQVAITLSGFMNSAIAADSFAGPITAFLSELGVAIPISLLNTLVIVLITIILSYISLVFGELVPKRIAMQKPYEIAQKSVGVIIFISKLFSPLVHLLSVSQNLVLRIMHFKVDDTSSSVTEEDIQIMLNLGGQTGAIEEDEKEWIQNVFNFNDISVEESMTRKGDVVAIEIGSTVDEIVNIIKESGLSRFPVYEDDLNNIIGILNTREFLLNLTTPENKRKNIKELVRPAYFVPESIRADVVFNDMQKKKLPFAIVIDEYGETSGIITMEDLVEEIVGNIYDEFDPAERPEIEKIDENKWRVEGSVYIDDLAEEIGTDIEKDESYDTIGGMVLSLLHTIPKDGSRLVCEINNLHIEVTKISNRRIEEAIVSVIPDNEGSENNEVDSDKKGKSTGRVIEEIGPDGKPITENIDEEE